MVAGIHAQGGENRLAATRSLVREVLSFRKKAEVSVL